MTATASRGTPFGRYRLVERLGEGGMAVVYRAMIDGPDRFARSVVVKRIRPSRSADVEFQRMFAHEARICGLLHHPAIVQVHEFGEINGEAFLVMEYVEGYDLAWIMTMCSEEQRLVPIEVTCHVMLELAAAIGYAHALRGEDGKALGLVHRDISPSNVVLTPHGGVKLLDFGIAKLSAAFDGTEQTLSGTLKGKVSYMSPEQADGRTLDGRSDLFSLGIVFHEMLTRRRLFRTRDDLETLRRIREADVAAPSEMRPEIEPELDAIVLRLLSRNPDTRFQTAEALVEALQPIAHWLHADSRRTAHFLRAMKPRPALDAAESSQLSNDFVVAATMPEPARRRARGTRLTRFARWSLPFAAGLAGLGIAGWLLTRPTEASRSTAVHVESQPAPTRRLDAPADAFHPVEGVQQGPNDARGPARSGVAAVLPGRPSSTPQVARGQAGTPDAVPPKTRVTHRPAQEIKDPFLR